MPKAGMTKERAALEATRSRLEAALSADANWRALQRSRTQASADEGAPPAHDARLELLLLANPLFRAWKHVDDAIEDLRGNEPSADRPGASGRLVPIPTATGPNAAKQIASLADLSEGIARLIQRTLPGGGRAPAPRRLEIAAEMLAEEPAEPPPVETPQAIDPRPAVVADAAGPELPDPGEWQPPAVPVDAPVEPAAPPEAEPAPAVPALASEPSEVRSPAATPLRPRRNLGPTEPEADEPPFRPGLEPEEATVTFVTREPVARRSSRTARTHAPFGWAPTRAHEQADIEARLDIAYAPNDDIEEAEVTILTAEDMKERQETAQRDGNLRRFRRALLGD